MSGNPQKIELVRKWRRLTRDWVPYIEDTIPATDLSLQMRRYSIPSVSFFFMLALASVISTFGLIGNSAPAIIGAMIIAPLMAPIISFSHGLVIMEMRLIRWSILTVVAGTILAVAIGYVTTMVLGLRIAGSEILSRTSPSLIDFGVALAAGGAAAFSHTRRSIMSSLAGVAIAVALVPPLSVTGIGLALGRTAASENALSLSVFGLFSRGADIAAGSFVLFLTNFIGIVAVAVLVFVAQRYGKWSKALLALLLCAGLSAFVFQPLHQAFRKMYVKSQTVQLISEISESRPKLFSGNDKIQSIRVNFIDDVPHVTVDFYAPRERAGNLQLAADLLSQYLSTEIGEPVVFELELIGVDLARTRSQTPDLSNSKGSQFNSKGSESVD